MKDLKLFLPQVELHVSGCPERVMLQALLAASREFCQRARPWRETLFPLGVQDGWAEYDLEPPRYTEIVAVVNLQYRGRKLHEITEDELNATRGWMTARGEPSRFVQMSQTAVRLYPCPAIDAVDALDDIRVALCPTPDAPEVGDVLYDRYAEQLVRGALARLLAIPEKPWTDVALAGAYKQMFEQDVADAQTQALTGYGNAPLRVRPRPIV